MSAAVSVQCVCVCVLQGESEQARRSIREGRGINHAKNNLAPREFKYKDPTKINGKFYETIFFSPALGIV